MAIKKIDYKKVVIYSLASLIPIIMVLMGYKKLAIYPFGDNSLLSMDLWGQYFPMISEQQENRSNLILNLFSWNGSLGFNSYAQSAYYCNSIFNYIFVFFSKENLVNVLDMVILLKFGLASLSFCVFLNNKFKKLSYISVGCSVAYALCAYTIAFVNQPMWFDAVIFFPMIILGLERLVINKKPLVYCIFLALTIYSSFYIGFSICLFSVIYFIVTITSTTNILKFKEIRTAFINFAVFSLLAGGLVAFVILPIYNAVNLTIASGIQAPNKLEFYNSAIQYLSKLMPETKLSWEFGIPNIYSGALVLIMIPLFISNKNIITRKKIVFTSLIVFLYLSMNLNILNYVWHGFHLPNQLPGRWTFIVSFVLLMLSYEALINFDGLSKKGVLISLMHSIIFIGLLKTLPKTEQSSNKIFIYVVLIMIVYAAAIIMMVVIKTKNLRVVISIMISLIIIVDVGSNAVNLFDNDVPTSQTESFQHADVPMSNIVNKYESKNNDFYRMEMYEGWTFNPGQLYNYKGISYYSSTMSGKNYEFLTDLGYKVYAQNVSAVYNPYSPVLNSAFSVKYIADKSNQLDLPGFNVIDKTEKFRVLENKYTLPVAFIADKKILDWKHDNSTPVEVQNSFFNGLMGSNVNVFKKVELDSLNANNASLIYNDSYSAQTYTRQNPGEPVYFKFTYTSVKDQYLYLQQNFRKGDMIVRINEKQFNLNVSNEMYRSLGHLNAGDKVTITLSVSDVDLGLWGVDLYSFDEAKFAQCQSQLLKSSVDVVESSNTKIKCKINAKNDGLLYTSIPNDNGWTIKCDGEKQEIKNIGNCLISTFITKGEHEIEFEYHVPGLGLGIFISILCLCVIIAYVLLRKNQLLVFKNLSKNNEPLHNFAAPTEDLEKDTIEDESPKNATEEISDEII